MRVAVTNPEKDDDDAQIEQPTGRSGGLARAPATEEVKQGDNVLHGITEIEKILPPGDKYTAGRKGKKEAAAKPAKAAEIGQGEVMAKAAEGTTKKMVEPHPESEILRKYRKSSDHPIRPRFTTARKPEEGLLEHVQRVVSGSKTSSVSRTWKSHRDGDHLQRLGVGVLCDAVAQELMDANENADKPIRHQCEPGFEGVGRRLITIELTNGFEPSQSMVDRAIYNAGRSFYRSMMTGHLRHSSLILQLIQRKDWKKPDDDWAPVSNEIGWLFIVPNATTIPPAELPIEQL
ncbi:unnamed protein product, partial [Mesorhabditis spiculigera]